jgi:hypothetical protein
MKRHFQTTVLATFAFALAIAPVVGNARATTSGDEGTPAEASLVAAAVDTTHRSSVSTPVQPGARPTNVPLQNPMNFGLNEAQARMQNDVTIEATRLDQAAIQNQTRLVDRLATEFGMTSRSLRNEQRTLNATWGDLILAHTLAASSDGNATVETLMQLRARGANWATIASDMGFSLEDVVAAMRLETQAATGMVKGDGRLTTLARGNAASTTTIEKTHTGAKIIRGSGAEPTKTSTTAEEGSK